ncbi:MAG: hypothetical protein U0074_00175 [Kouleothrix sp.]
MRELVVADHPAEFAVALLRLLRDSAEPPADWRSRARACITALYLMLRAASYDAIYTQLAAQQIKHGSGTRICPMVSK